MWYTYRLSLQILFVCALSLFNQLCRQQGTAGALRVGFPDNRKCQSGCRAVVCIRYNGKGLFLFICIDYVTDLVDKQVGCLICLLPFTPVMVIYTIRSINTMTAPARKNRSSLLVFLFLKTLFTLFSPIGNRCFYSKSQIFFSQYSVFRFSSSSHI